MKILWGLAVRTAISTVMPEMNHRTQMTCPVFKPRSPIPNTPLGDGDLVIFSGNYPRGDPANPGMW